MEDFSDIINLDNLYKSSKTFKRNKPFKHAFVEEIFHRDFYEKLYNTYPEINEKFTLVNSISKIQYWRGWDKRKDVENGISNNKEDPSLSKEWNKFLRYIMTDEFASHFSSKESFRFAFAVSLHQLLYWYELNPSDQFIVLIFT